MKRNFDAPLIRIDGTPFVDQQGEGAVPMTLKMLAFHAVSMQIRGDENMSIPQKMELYNMVGKTAKGGVIELEAEDIALLKDRIGKAFPPLVIGEAFRLLELDYVEPAGDAQVA